MVANRRGVGSGEGIRLRSCKYGESTVATPLARVRQGAGAQDSCSLP